MNYRRVLSIEEQLFGVNGLAVDEQAVEVNAFGQGCRIQRELSLPSLGDGEALECFSLHRRG